MAVDAQGWDRLRQVIVEFLFPPFADFVSRMTGVTPHIERGMATSFFRHIQPLRMAIETEIFPLLARSGFQQLKLVVGGVGIVALEAVANGWRVDRPF